MSISVVKRRLNIYIYIEREREGERVNIPGVEKKKMKEEESLGNVGV